MPMRELTERHACELIDRRLNALADKWMFGESSRWHPQMRDYHIDLDAVLRDILKLLEEHANA